MTDRAKGWISILGTVLGAGAIAWIARRSSGPLGGPADDWWRRPIRYEHKLCHRTKHEALQALRDANRRLIDDWGGLDAVARPADFDAINHSRGLKDERAVRTIAQALWVAMPPRPPFCLDEVDFEALNDTAPGRTANGFQLPDWAADQIAEKEWHRHYAELEP